VFKESNMKNVTLLMVGILSAVAMLSVGVVAVPIQQASANSDGGDGGADTSFKFNQEQSNKCSGSAICTNDGTIDFTPPIVIDDA
jgi:hypothetical protein